MALKETKTVYVVHCVDTEGPLCETIEDTFHRIRQIYGIDLAATKENLVRLQRREIDLKDKTDLVRRLVDPKLIKFNENWTDITKMLDVITKPTFRKRYVDALGNGWLFNWFCVDHVGYTLNPRKRDIGDHTVFDYYRALLEKDENRADKIYFHYHALPYNRMAHASATFYLNQNHIFEILAKKIIERQWFPSVFRPGFHTTRPDSNWFLEQWIPFDYANQATDSEINQPDLAGGRFGDWRRAPKLWGGYHPSHDDYQRIGSCRRWIFRCLNMESRLRELSLDDINDAFSQAEDFGASVLAFTDHDFRDMATEISKIYSMIVIVSRRWPHVKFQYCSALEAARAYLKMITIEDINLKLSFSRIGGNAMEMTVTTDAAIFGPQPFMAVKVKNGQYYYDNFDFTLTANCWKYTFDWQTFTPDWIERIGVATSGNQGQVEIAIHDVQTSQTRIKKLNYSNEA